MLSELCIGAVDDVWGVLFLRMWPLLWQWVQFVVSAAVVVVVAMGPVCGVSVGLIRVFFGSPFPGDAIWAYFPHTKHIVLCGKANVEVKMRAGATTAGRGEWPLSLRYGSYSSRGELDGDLIRALNLVRYEKRICRTREKKQKPN